MNSKASPSLFDRYVPALGQRNFRLFWTGQCVSLIGTWMQNVGQSWLVLELTDSPLKLGILNACQFLPVMLLSLFAGPFVDRFPKRRMLILTQGALLVLALILAVLTITGLVRYWTVLVLALLLGLVNTVDIPTRQSFVIEISGREALMNAVSLNSASFNAARILGPAAAGLIIGSVGIAACFFINALSFAAVILALFRMKLTVPGLKPPAEKPGRVAVVIGEGLSYIRDQPELLRLLALLSTFVINYNVMIPTFSRSELGLDAKGYGFVMTAMGLGSLAAALTQTFRSGRGSRAAVLFGGVTPVGAMYAGTLIDATSAATCMIVSGAIGLGATWIVFRGARRPGGLAGSPRP